MKWFTIVFILMWATLSQAEEFISLGSKKQEVISTEYVNEVFKRVSEEIGVPQELLRAICWNESHFNPEAYNHGDGKGNNHAFGICQVLYQTAKEKGLNDENCTKDFQDVVIEDGTFVKAERNYKSCKLFGVYTNVTYAAIFLKEKLVQYDNSWVSAIAAYNAGQVRICKKGYVKRAKDNTILWKCTKGGILNQKYVDDVLQALREKH